MDELERDEDLTRTAQHEAGHAIAAHRLGRRIDRVSAVPVDENKAGATIMHPLPSDLMHDESFCSDRAAIDREAIIFLAGHAAEQSFGYDFPYGTLDWKAAEWLAKLALRSDEDEAALNDYIEARFEDAVKFIKRRRRSVARLADTLYKRRELTGDEAIEIIKRRPS